MCYFFIDLSIIIIVWFLGAIVLDLGRMIFDSGGSLPDGVERIRLRRMHAHGWLIYVKYAWYLRKYDCYTALVESKYLKDSDRIDAKTKEELERKVDLVIEDYSRRIDKKKQKR